MESAANTRGRRVEIVGEVTSDKMNKTRTVVIFRLVKHPKYGKRVKRSTVLKVHDENNVSKVGDRVLVKETRPLSKTKRFQLLKVVEAAKA